MELRLAATMNKASRAGGTPRCRRLPDEVVVWEILVRLPPKPLLGCRVVCRPWCRATLTRTFLQAHHDHQPCLPIFLGSEYGNAFCRNILTFDHRVADAKLLPVVQLEPSFYPEASCDGLLILSNHGTIGTSFFVCNPTMCQHVPVRQLSGFGLLAMYQHRSTSEYRLLVQQLLKDQIGCYIFALGSDQPLRYIGGLESASSAYLRNPALVHDCLHWYPLLYHSDPRQYQIGSKVVIVFDTISESFRQMRAPLVPAKSYIFEVDGTIGIYSYNDAMKFFDIWMLLDYGSEVWRYKYNVKLPVIEMKEQVGGWWNDNWYFNIHSFDGDILVLVNHGRWMFYVDTDGKLVDSFLRDGQHVYACQFSKLHVIVRKPWARSTTLKLNG